MWKLQRIHHIVRKMTNTVMKKSIPYRNICPKVCFCIQYGHPQIVSDAIRHISVLSQKKRNVYSSARVLHLFGILVTSSNGNVTGPLFGEFTDHRGFPLQRPMTRSFDVFFYLCLNKRLSKQSWGMWFETPSRSLWSHCNDVHIGIVRSSIIIPAWECIFLMRTL